MEIEDESDFNTVIQSRQRTLGTEIKEDTGMDVIKVEEDYTSSDDETIKEKDQLLIDRVKPLIRDIRQYLNSNVAIRRTNLSGKVIGRGNLTRLETEIQRLETYIAENPKSKESIHLMHQLTNLKNELESKLINVYGSLSGGLKKISKKKHNNKKRRLSKKRRGKKKRQTSKKY